MLQRFGGLDEQNISLEIDNLGYRYGAGSNRLLAVNDASGSPEGFSDGTNSGDDFAYDASGNMTSDKNKNITSIAYNHLNLPVRIVFGGDLNTRVDYVYDALGAKLQKTFVQYNPVGDHSIVLTSVTDYLGFQYKDGVLQFFPTSEGYVSHTKGSYSYVYNYTDHLGNVRMSYAKNPARPSELKVIEENHYYPFGLKHQNYNSEEFLFDKKDSNLQLRAPVGGQILPYQYKFQGQERQDELGLNWDSFKWRNYDYAIGRFMNIDPLAEDYTHNSPYAFAENKVMSHIELEGLEGIHSSKIDAAGNRVHTIQKNVIILVQMPRTPEEGANPKKAERIQKQNDRIDKSNNEKVDNLKSELKKFYSNAKNLAGEMVNFDFNVTTKSVENTNVKPSREMSQLALDNGIQSSTTLFDGGPEQIAPAAIISTAGAGSNHGITDGVVVRTNYGSLDGTKSHEIGHTLKLRDNYDGNGIMANPPNHVSNSEVDEIIKKSYTKK